MKVQAAAKINLMLDVLGTLPDGYHSLFMIMQSVDCCDTVTVHQTTTQKIVLKSEDKRMPLDGKNIAYKAAELFFKETEAENTGVEIEIEKTIPMAAGLAGGSADAAAVLYALNEIFKTGLTLWELARIGEKIGADVPFSLIGGTALSMDKGGVLAPLPTLKDCYIVLCKPKQDISTVGAYRQIDESPYLRHADTVSMLYAMRTENLDLMCHKAQNIFEQVIEVPQRPHIKAMMRAYGAKLTMMSGSGPTVYGIFQSEKAAKECTEELKKEYDEVFCCAPLSAGIRVIEP